MVQPLPCRCHLLNNIYRLCYSLLPSYLFAERPHSFGYRFISGGLFDGVGEAVCCHTFNGNGRGDDAERGVVMAPEGLVAEEGYDADMYSGDHLPGSAVMYDGGKLAVLQKPERNTRDSESEQLSVSVQPLLFLDGPPGYARVHTWKVLGHRAIFLLAETNHTVNYSTNNYFSIACATVEEIITVNGVDFLSLSSILDLRGSACSRADPLL